MDILKIIGMFFLVILSFVVLASVPPLILAHSAKAVVFSPAFYEGQFEKHNLYEKVRDVAIDSLSNMGEGETAIPEELKADLKERIKTAMPASWVKKQANGLLENLLSFLKGEKEKLELKISLKEIKPDIATAAEDIMEKSMETMIEEKINETLGGIPPQLDELLKSGMGPGGCSSVSKCVIYCSEPENKEECDKFSEGIGLPLLGTEAESLGIMPSANFTAVVEEQIPDEIDMGKEMEKSGAYQQMVEVRDTLKTAFFVMDILWIVPILALVLIVLITRNAKDACGWIGGALLGAGIAALLIAFLAPMAAGKMVEGINQPGGEAAEFTVILKDIAVELIGAIFGGVLIPAGVITVAGLGLLISSRFLH